MKGCPVEKYFPPGEKRNVVRKWKDVPKELYRDGLIENEPDLDLSQLGELKKYRDGLAHASASRPRISGQAEGQNPVPPVNLLNDYPRGEAVEIVAQLVIKLHKDLHQSPPEYIRLPELPPQSYPSSSS